MVCLCRAMESSIRKSARSRDRVARSAGGWGPGPGVGADADEFQVLTEDGHRLVLDVQDDLAVGLPDHPIPRAAPQPKVEIGLQTRPRKLRHYDISVHAWYFTGCGSVLAPSCCCVAHTPAVPASGSLCNLKLL